MDEKLEILSNWMNGKEAPPITIEINVTNRCNQKCLSCWQRNGNINYDELSEEKWLDVVKEASEMGIKEIRLPGSGEPLMRKDLILKIMEEAKKGGMEGLLITNGTLFEENSVRKVVDMEWDNVTFSIDGPDVEMNDYLRGVEGAFEASTRWLKEFVRLKQELKKDKPILRINVVLSNKNYDKLEKMIELAHELGCNAVSIQPMTVFSSLGEELKLNKKQLKELPKHINNAKQLAEKYRIHTNVDSFLESEVIEKANEMDEVMKSETKNIENRFLSLPCFEPWYNIIITPNGIAGPCSMFGGVNGVSIADKKLAEIWYGKYFTNIRERLLKKDLFDFCKNCCVVVFEENKRLRNEISKRIDNQTNQ